MYKSVNVLRLTNGQKLIEGILDYCEQKNISSAIIIGIIGSLKKMCFLPKDSKWGFVYEDHEEPLPLLSAQGTLALFNEKIFPHIHVSLLAENGRMIGGHLVEAEVWATAEVVIGELKYTLFRDYDAEIGMSEIHTT